MRKIGLLDIFKKNKELEQMYDLDLLESDMERGYMKRLALETCINFIARTISQTEFRQRRDGKTIKDQMYYQLNIKPNINQTASEFWQKVISRLLYDNECLIIQSDTGDLFVADDFTKTEYGLVPDKFSGVTIKNYTYNRSFSRDECIYIRYANESLERLINSLYEDYGKLFGRIFEFQMRKNQVRASMKLKAVMGKDDKTSEKMDSYLDRVRQRLESKAVAFFPLQDGVEYNEHSKNQGVSAGVDEVNKVYEGSLEIVAKAFNIPVNLLRGDMADIEDQMKSYFMLCIDPLLKGITDELNAQLVDRSDYLNGEKIESKRVRYSNIFDVATAIDKIRASGVGNGNELRDEVGWDRVDDPEMDRYVMTKNYTTEIEGGDKNAEEN